MSNSEKELQKKLEITKKFHQSFGKFYEFMIKCKDDYIVGKSEIIDTDFYEYMRKCRDDYMTGFFPNQTKIKKKEVKENVTI